MAITSTSGASRLEPKHVRIPDPNEHHHSLYNPMGSRCAYHDNTECDNPMSLILYEALESAGSLYTAHTRRPNKNHVLQHIYDVWLHLESDERLASMLMNILKSLDVYLHNHPVMFAALVHEPLQLFVACHPKDDVLFTIDDGELTGMNLYGSSVSLYKYRFERGLPVLGSRTSNAYAVAMLHHSPMRGVALPGISPSFDPSTFPNTRRVDIVHPTIMSEKGDASEIGSPADEKVTQPTILPIKVRDAKSFESLVVEVPEATETTGNYTKSKDPNAKHWKSIISWTDGSNKCSVLNIKDVVVSKNPGSSDNYGTSYVFIGFPAYVRDIFKKKVVLPVAPIIDDERFESGGDYWWHTIYQTKDLATSIDTAGKKERWEVKHILESTGKAFTIAVDVTFELKFKTTDKSNYDKKKHALTLAVSVIRGKQDTLGVDIDPPKMVWSGNKRATPDDLRTTKSDVTPDATLKMLASMRIRRVPDPPAEPPKNQGSKGKGRKASSSTTGGSGVVQDTKK